MLPLLSLQIWIPIIGAVFVLLGNDKNPQRTRFLALGVNLLTLLLCIPLWQGFDVTTHAMQFHEHLNWIPQFKINYDLGVDGISMPLIVLNVFTTTVVLLATWRSIEFRVSQYLAAFLIMQGLITGVLKPFFS